MHLRLVALNGLLLASIALSVGLLGLQRSDAAIGGAVRRYAAAVTSQDLDAALAEIAPDERAAWRDWIAGQLGNIYEVRGIAVRVPSLLDRVVRGAAPQPYEVSVVFDINRDYPDEYFQPTPRIPVEQVDGRWYLSRPPLGERVLGSD